MQQTYQFSQKDVDNFIINCRRRKLHTATINSYLRALKVYGNYINSDVSIRFLKQDEIVKEIYTQEEIRKLLVRPSTKRFSEFKTWALVNFLLGTGCRLSTALEIKVEDVDFESAMVLFRHMKNHKNQYFPLSKVLAGVLKQYLIIRGNSGYLFCNSYGEKADKRTVQLQIANYNRSRGVNKTSCHLFRHTFAAEYIRNGGDAFMLQKLLGHSTLEMTRKYVNLYGVDLHEGIENFSPLDRNTKALIKMKN